MIITRAFPASDLEAFRVEAVANGWIVTAGISRARDCYVHGEQFVFSTPEDLAGWIKQMLPMHGGEIKNQGSDN